MQLKYPIKAQNAAGSESTDVAIFIVPDGSINGNEVDISSVDGIVAGVTYSQITSNQNNYSLVDGNETVARLTTDASRDITGFTVDGATASDGFWAYLLNVGANNIVLKHQSTSSDAANRIISSTGADIILSTDQMAEMWYDVTTGRWRLFKKN